MSVCCPVIHLQLLTYLHLLGETYVSLLFFHRCSCSLLLSQDCYCCLNWKMWIIPAMGNICLIFLGETLHYCYETEDFHIRCMDLKMKGHQQKPTHIRTFLNRKWVRLACNAWKAPASVPASLGVVSRVVFLCHSNQNVCPCLRPYEAVKNSLSPQSQLLQAASPHSPV